MGFTLGEIARHLGGEVVGDEDYVIEGVASIEEAGEKDLTFVADKKHLAALAQSPAGAVIVDFEVQSSQPHLIQVENAYLSFAQAIELIVKPHQKPVRGISEKAHIEEGVEIGEKVSIYPGAYIGKGVKIGENTRIYPGAYVGAGTTIGDNCIIYANVSIYEGCEIGSRVILHSGVVIGADGFGFVTHEGVHHKFPQVGKVVIEDDVEVGANSTIDRAALGETRVGQGTKMDDLVMVAHNVKVGRGCLFVAQSGVAGSTIIGDYVALGGQCAVRDHIKVGSQAKIAAKAGITKDVPEGEFMLGAPAYPAREKKRILAVSRKLPELKRRVDQLERKVAQMEDGKS